jgi:hypothetical protein
MLPPILFRGPLNKQRREIHRTILLQGPLNIFSAIFKPSAHIHVKKFWIYNYPSRETFPYSGICFFIHGFLNRLGTHTERARRAPPPAYQGRARGDHPPHQECSLHRRKHGSEGEHIQLLSINSHLIERHWP